MLITTIRWTARWFLFAMFVTAGQRPAIAQWSQWGGPQQDFTVPSRGLTDGWPESGPPRIWERPLGEGYSAILHDDSRLYTLYRKGNKDFVCALKASDGSTIWEYGYESPPDPGHVMQFTAGPRSTPLLDKGRLFTASVAGIMHCLDADTGKVIWKHDLWKELKGSVLNHGYSSSPFPYKDMIIVLVGGEAGAVIAFDAKDGSVRWRNEKVAFKNSYSTPKLIQVDGKDQLACFMAQQLIGIDPMSGKLLWQTEIGNEWDQNIVMPTYTDDKILVYSTNTAGTRAARMTKQDDGTYQLEPVWDTRKVQFYHNNTVELGDYLYGSSGTRQCFFCCVNTKTGELAWRKRGFAKATCLYADGKFIILDENGVLGLAKATPESFEVLAKTEVMKPVSWTIPTLVGTTLYVRDKETIVAFDLAKKAADPT